MDKNNLDYLFNPKSVAIVGASRNTKKIGHVILRNFVFGFSGDIYPINPNIDSILGLKSYAKISDVPKNIDLVIFAVSAELIPKILKECKKKKVKAAIIISGGFSEVGNVALENEIKAIAKSTGIRLLGPNCIGVYDSYSKVDSLFLPAYRLGRPPKGNIALISQSGALGGAMLDWANMHGYGFSKFVSYGNAADIDESDLLEYLGNDPHTKLICLYTEGIKDGKKFLSIAKKVTKKKPVVAIKGGVTEAGARAVSSHTAALAGSAKVYEAAFRQADIIQANDLEELLDFSRAIVSMQIPKGNRVLVITNGGGLGILSTDAIVNNNLQMAELSKETINNLRSKLPTYAVIGNPIDLVGDADSARYELAIDAALNDPNIDMLLINILFQIPTLSSDIVEIISEKFNKRKMPIAVVCFGGDYTMTHKKALENYGVPTFNHPERAVEALRCLFQRAQDLRS